MENREEIIKTLSAFGFHVKDNMIYSEGDGVPYAKFTTNGVDFLEFTTNEVENGND